MERRKIRAILQDAVFHFAILVLLFAPSLPSRAYDLSSFDARPTAGPTASENVAIGDLASPARVNQLLHRLEALPMHTTGPSKAARLMFKLIDLCPAQSFKFLKITEDRLSPTAQWLGIGLLALEQVQKSELPDDQKRRIGRQVNKYLKRLQGPDYTSPPPTADPE